MHTGMNTYMLPQKYVVFSILTFYTDMLMQCKRWYDNIHKAL